MDDRIDRGHTMYADTRNEVVMSVFTWRVYDIL